MPSSARYGSLSFAEQIAFFRAKLDVPTDAWTDVYAAEHDHSFMVAGARGEVLTDLRRAVTQFIEEGKTLPDFRKDFDAIVARTGWAYNGGRNWRTRIIYETNLRQSYSAGREAQMADPALRKARPYGLYRHGGSAEPRPEHLSWDGTVLPLDDPWWDTHTPQNAWGCKCKKFSLSARDVERMGLKVAEQAPPMEWEEVTVGARGPSPRTVRVPKGVDPGFEYRPGMASRARAMTPPPLDTPASPVSGMPLPADALPAPRSAPATRKLPAGLPAEEYVRAFLAEFGATERPAYFSDLVGGRLLISDQLFRDRAGRLKVTKRGRERDVLLLADTIKEPDEIWEHWVELAPGIEALNRVYLAQFMLEGESEPLLAAFELGRFGWVGVTAYGPDSLKTLLKNRTGVRVYRREQ